MVKIRRRREKGSSTPPSVSNAFRDAERLFKDRTHPPRLSLAFDFQQIVWDDSELEGKLRGVWKSGSGEEVVCYKVPLDGLSEFEMGQSRWKGKGKQSDKDYAIIIPRIPGLVFFPSILPEALQRSLVEESLQNAKQPNVTSLDPHYLLPEEGLWNAWTSGRGYETVERIDLQTAASGVVSGAEEQVVGKTTSSIESLGSTSTGTIDSKAKEVTVGELVPKLRWSNVGYHYNWTTKLYEFDRPFVPIPPLMLSCCRTLARAMPWQHVFPSAEYTGKGESSTSDDGWELWKTTYEPDAGIVNFYQAKDSLTGHTDHSEIDSVQPLVSLSLGLSSIFLVGGLTKDIPPLAILLRSGDGLIMSGRQGRRAYHGLPRVLENTLPDYLRAKPSGVDGELDEEEEAERIEWEKYGDYLERGARININLRSGTKGSAT
ncbi:uncharacterized protein JCM6883_004805 [Sporobolomyces salmoneus]|uniref:uncharacterized protein n=1 Tax=Sporobolomyces salmoneus TaxID=183962 RepID=UPI0031709B51